MRESVILIDDARFAARSQLGLTGAKPGSIVEPRPDR